MREPGYYDGIDIELYHAGDELSSSGLKELALTEAHYIASKKNRPHRHEVIGTLTHMRTMERDRFDSTVLAIEGHRGNKGVKEEIAAAEASGKFVCKPEEYADVVAMSDAILMHPKAKFLFMSGVAERSFYWTDPETEAPLRCRTDYIIPDRMIVTDIKYFTNLTDIEIRRQIRRMKYDWSAAFYEDGVQAVMGEFVQVFAHVFVEAPRFPGDHIGVRVITIDEEDLGTAREQYRPLIEKFAKAYKSNKWASYSDEIVSLRALPRTWEE